MGGVAIFPDGIRTADYDISAFNTMKHQRADTGNFELAQTGQVYFSPDQRGGIYGPVLRQFIPANTAHLTTFATGVARILYQGVHVTDTVRIYVSPLFDLTSYAMMRILESTKELQYITAGSWTVVGGYVDYTLVVPPTGTPSSGLNVTTDPTVLQRVDNLMWETAQDGVRYFSPDQRGGRYGKVIRRYVPSTGVTVSPTTIDTGVSRLLSQDLQVDDTVRKYISPLFDLDNYAMMRVLDSTGELQVIFTSQWAAAITGGYADYTLVTPPTTTPTGQPFANPFTTQMKRVDNGNWENPQDGVAYQTKYKHLGETVQCIRYTVASPTSGSNQFFAVQPATLTKYLKVEGSYKADVPGQYSPVGIAVGSYNCAPIQALNGGRQKLGYNATASVSDLEIWFHYRP